MKFHPKLVAFYAASIVGVIVLFQIVTTYGKTVLVAPPKIDGAYRVQASTETTCLPIGSVLVIQQSGVYLTGSLLPSVTSDQLRRLRTAPTTLQGRWQAQTINLTGKLPLEWTCPGTTKVNLRGTLQGERLQGEWFLTSPTLPIRWQAERQKPETTPLSEIH